MHCQSHHLVQSPGCTILATGGSQPQVRLKIENLSTTKEDESIPSRAYTIHVPVGLHNSVFNTMDEFDVPGVKIL